MSDNTSNRTCLTCEYYKPHPVEDDDLPSFCWNCAYATAHGYADHPFWKEKEEPEDRRCFTCKYHIKEVGVNVIPVHCWDCINSERLGRKRLPFWEQEDESSD